MDKSAIYLSQTRLVAIYRPRRDGGNGWPGREPNQEPGIGSTRQPAPSRTAVTGAHFALCDIKIELFARVTGRTFFSAEAQHSV